MSTIAQQRSAITQINQVNSLFVSLAFGALNNFRLNIISNCSASCKTEFYNTLILHCKDDT